MSLNKPEINYDTALYALQENVVLKQRLEEHNSVVEKINSNHSSQIIFPDALIMTFGPFDAP